MFCNTAFQYESKHDEIIWIKIPKDVDLLITHGPPYEILDRVYNGKNAGSKALRQMSIMRKPKYHIFGHIHEAQGMKLLKGMTFVNVARQPTRLVF